MNFTPMPDRSVIGNPGIARLAWRTIARATKGPVGVSISMTSSEPGGKTGWLVDKNKPPVEIWRAGARY